MGFPGDSVVKNLAAQARDARDMGSIPGSGRAPGRGIGNPLQYSRPENPVDRGAWRASPWGGKELDMAERLSTQRHLKQHIRSLIPAARTGNKVQAEAQENQL